MKVSDLSEDKIIDGAGKPATSAKRSLMDIQTAFENLSTGNFKGRVIPVTIPSGSEIKVPHNLKVVPIGYIIIRQRGLGFVTDGAVAWTDKYITLKNNAISLTASGTFGSDVAVLDSLNAQGWGASGAGSLSTTPLHISAGGLNSSFSGGGSTNVSESVKLLVWILGG